MRTLRYDTDLCIIGGGLSGLCCALAASRHRIKTILVQDRAMIGGNSSSEIRMHICGSKGKNNRESGIIEELILKNLYTNPSSLFPLWDLVLYDKAISEKNLTLLLNSSCLDAEMNGNSIVSIKAWQSNAETFHEVHAKYFADCSGDSILSTLTGAEFMYGREAKSEFSETIPPDVADKKTMGMSCLFQIRETDHKTTYIPPKWAYKYETDADLPFKDHTRDDNFWWIEVGGEWDCLHDTDRCREELLKFCCGVWDHMNNKGDHGVDNWELEWIGMYPGKRESRRYVGKYIVTQNDVEAEGRFHDLVAYAGWPMDDHFPAGFYYTEGHPTIFHPAPQPWGLPLRCMISKNIENLVFAGRNISVTHAALSSSRVMATCAILGQALGTAAALAIHDNCHIEKVDIKKLQAMLMEDDCYLPWHSREVSALSKEAKCSHEVVRNGIDRGDENLYIGKKGESIEYSFDDEREIKEIRLVFDSNLERKFYNMPCNHPLNDQRFNMPKTLIKEYILEFENNNGEIEKIEVTDNHQRFVKHKVNLKAKKVRLIPTGSYGCDEMRVFDFEIR